jgi:deazaflavin-dependent oxidoreductase (nitroreductase family)
MLRDLVAIMVEFVNYLRPPDESRNPIMTNMNSVIPEFRQPTAVEKFFNRALGALIGMGIGPAHIYLLEVRGRKTGKLYTTPVDPLELNGKRYLVAPRGRTQWVRNAEAAGEIVLRRGGHYQKVRLRSISDPEKPPILKAYLDQYKREVQRYFPVTAGSPPEAFTNVAASYPAFELLTN